VNSGPQLVVMDRVSADDAASSRSSGGQPPPPGDRELVASALDDVEAFAELYRRHVRDVHAYVQRRCGSTTLADDITAAAFERALRNLRSFRWRDGGFRAWVFRIAGNELIDHHRREAAAHRRDRRLFTNHEMIEPDPAELFSDQHSERDGDALRRALERLRPRYAEAIALRHLSGLEVSEAAAAMQLSKATFAVTLHRAMRALHHELEVES
jgi:RNA polymerase sigma-70 factor, ECF subfamily